MSIFRSCDVRGTYPDEFNEEKAYRIGRALATMLDGGAVAVGGDVRHSSAGLKTALIDGLVASGSEVIDVGMLPTPAYEFALRRLRTAAGVMVTATCRHAHYNGLKITIGQLPISPHELSRLKSMIDTNGFLSCRRSSRQVDPLPEYEQHIVDFGSKMLRGVECKPKVVVDCGGGCLSDIAPRVFGKLSIPATFLNCKIDGSFRARDPNPFASDSLRDLSTAVISEQADLGIAFDAVGDRVAFVDERGVALSPDEAVSVIASKIRGIGPGEKVVLSVKCGSAVSEVISGLGATPIVERSGKSFIMARMISEDARLGAGAGGHVFYRELNGSCDGLFSAILMASIIGSHGPLSRLSAALPKYALTADVRVRARPDASVLDSIAAAFPVERVTRLDGIKVLFKDGWGLARVSSGEPAMDFRFEGADEVALRRIIDEFLEPTPILKSAVLRSYKG